MLLLNMLILILQLQIIAGFNVFATDVDNSVTMSAFENIEFSDVVFGNGVYVAIGNRQSKGVIVSSNDGNKWSEAKIPDGVSFYEHSHSIVWQILQILK